MTSLPSVALFSKTTLIHACTDVIDGLFDELSQDYNSAYVMQTWEEVIHTEISEGGFSQSFEISYSTDDNLVIKGIIKDNSDATDDLVAALIHSIQSVSCTMVRFEKNQAGDIVAIITSPYNPALSMEDEQNIDSLDSIYQLIRMVIDERFF